MANLYHLFMLQSMPLQSMELKNIIEFGHHHNIFLWTTRSHSLYLTVRTFRMGY